MNNKRRTVVASLAVVLTSALLVGIAPSTAQAATLTSFAHDPTTYSVYYNFETDVGFDAYRVIVKEIGGTTRKVKGGHPHGSTTSISTDVITGLDCFDGAGKGRYKFILLVRWVHGGPWTVEQKFKFRTNGCP